MKKTISILFILLVLLIAGCTKSESNIIQGKPVASAEPRPIIHMVDYTPGALQSEKDLKENYPRATLVPYLYFNMTISSLGKDCNISLTNNGNEAKSFKMKATFIGGNQEEISDEQIKEVASKSMVMYRFHSDWLFKTDYCEESIDEVPTMGPYTDKFPFVKIWDKN
ncbi:MAG: hypothetical protein NT001_03435 [Candidatus Woesearchaeota archaeon]|nr:hypothetical protein [Candidatus Woesearchaeota archaeon]